MKRLHTGLIVLDTLDIVCISFSAGSVLAFLIRKYRERKTKKGEDPIISELKEKSPIIMFSEKGKPLKVPSIRGGDKIEGFSLVIKNKKLAILLRALSNAKRKQKLLTFLRVFFFGCNTVLTSSLGLRFALGGSMDYTQIILFAFPSTVGGFMMGLAVKNPLAITLLPLAILSGRGIKDIPDPYAKCKAICKVAEDFHNKQLAIEMKKLNSIVEDTSTSLQLPLDQVHLLCVEEKLSLLQRYKLKQLIKSGEALKRVQHFSEFIKKFSDCDANPEAVYEQIVGTISPKKIAEKITE